MRGLRIGCENRPRGFRGRFSCGRLAVTMTANSPNHFENQKWLKKKNN
jgi:hypothetical protein